MGNCGGTRGEREVTEGYAAMVQGVSVTDEQLERIWKEFDKNGDGILGPTGEDKVHIS